MKKLNYAVLFIFVFCLTSMLSAFDLKKEVIAKIPSEISSDLLGMRVYKNLVYIMSHSGKYITLDLNTQKVKNLKLDKVKSVVDFDIVVGKLIYLTDEGKISGHVFPKWPKGPFEACRLDVCDQGLMLSGGTNAYFLSKNASSSFELKDVSFALPINNGFIWEMILGKEKNWEANLYDSFGNLMGEIYKFSSSFKPSNIELGPKGIDGELVVSATEGKERTVSLIGNNKRMFWKINLSPKICKRDLAFSPLGNLMVLEKNNNGETILVKVSFATPEG